MAIHSLQLAIIIVSAAALGFLLGAFTSTKWVTGSQHKHPDGLRAGSIIKVHYGLFVGNTVSGADCNQTQRLHMACVAEEEICMQSCQPTKATRQRDIMYLLYGQDVNATCDGKGMIWIKLEKPKKGIENRRRLFISYKSYLLVIGFFSAALVFSCLAVTFAGLFSMTVKYPWLRSPSLLYFSNGMATVFAAAASISWSRQYDSLRKNIAIRETLRIEDQYEVHTPNQPGYSFHLITLSATLHTVCLLLTICMQMSGSTERPVTRPRPRPKASRTTRGTARR